MTTVTNLANGASIRWIGGEGGDPLRSADDILVVAAGRELERGAGDDTICCGTGGYDWRTINQAPRAPRRRK